MRFKNWTNLSFIRALLVFLCSFSFLTAKSKQDTGYRKPTPYQFLKDSEDARRLAARYLPSNPIIVEAGAYDGSESEIMARLWPEGHIHSFEPILDLYQNVVKNTQGIPNVSTYQLALGDAIDTRLIYLALNPETPEKICMSSSLFPPKDHLLYYGPVFNGTQTIQMTTLDAWAEANRIDHVDMLWLDMQGYELPAFKGASTLLAKVSVIMTEVNFSELYAGQPLYLEVKEWLEQQGFTLIGGDFTFPKDPNQHFGDALFVRKELIQQGTR